MLKLDLPWPSRTVRDTRDADEMNTNSEELNPTIPREPEPEGQFVGPLEADAVVDHGEFIIAAPLPEEERKAKAPSDMFLWAGLGTMATALTLHLSGYKTASLFVGQWAAPLLVLGVYNKVKRTETL